MPKKITCTCNLAQENDAKFDFGWKIRVFPQENWKIRFAHLVLACGSH